MSVQFPKKILLILFVWILLGNEMNIAEGESRKDYSRGLGVIFNSDLSIRRIAKSSAADNSDMMPGDKFLEMFGTKITSCEQIIDIYANASNKIIPLKINRNGEERKLTLKPTNTKPETDHENVERKIEEILACGKSLGLLPVITVLSYNTKPSVDSEKIENKNQKEQAASALTQLEQVTKDMATASLLSEFSWAPNFKIINRDLSPALLQELQFQQTGTVSAESRLKIGQLTGASHILLMKIFGELISSGINYRITTELIDIEKGEILAMDATEDTHIAMSGMPPKGTDRNSSNQISNEGKKGAFYVYADRNSNLNHYLPSGWMGDYGDLNMNQGWENGANGTCIRINYTARRSQGAGWAGVYWQNPANNWGDKKGGYNLSHYSKLTFYARGKSGGEIIDKFFIGGITGQTEPGDSDKAALINVQLSRDWQKYEIPLEGLDLSHIIGGFGFAANAKVCPHGFTMFLDNIRFESGD